MNDRLEVLKKASVAPGPYMDGYGITLRQHYAGLALQRLLANPGGPVQHSPLSGTHYCNSDEQQVAEWAVFQADALLAELAKGEPK